MLRQLSNGSPEGAQLGISATDKVGFWGRIPVPQRVSGMQGIVGPQPGGMIVTYQETLTPAVILTITAAEQALTVGTAAGHGPLLVGDFVATINKPTSQAGLGFHSARISADYTFQFVYSNPTAASLTPTASQVYNIVIIRGLPIITQTFTPALVPTKSSSETLVTVAPSTTATATATVSGGLVTDIRVTNGGAGYFYPPSVIITGVDPTQREMSGTGLGGGFDPSGSSIPPGLTAATVGAATVNPGTGATGEAIVSAAGVVIGVRITNQGSGYTTAPTVTFIGGNNITPGMALMITKPTQTAGIAISNCRIVGNNQIAVSFINPTAANITPTAELYSLMALPGVPAISNIICYGVQAGTLVSVATIVNAEQAVTVTGLLATDYVMGIQKPTAQTVGCCGGRVSAANTMQISFVNPTAAAVTPAASEVYGVEIYRAAPVAPFVIYNQLLTPVSVAANTCAEQTFTVTGLVASSTVMVNKPTHQPGLGIAGCRVSAADTLAINYENVTAAAITPTAEVYLIGNFTAVGPMGGAPGGWVGLQISPALLQTINLNNEEQEAMVLTGLIRG